MSEQSYEGNWKHLWLAMYEGLLEQKDLPPGVSRCNSQQELDIFHKGVDAHKRSAIQTLEDRATELRARADTHSTGSELARMKLNFAASEIEKLVDELKKPLIFGGGSGSPTRKRPS